MSPPPPLSPPDATGDDDDMSNDKPEDHETTVAHYRRADTSRFPTTPTGQVAAAEGMAAAHGFKAQAATPTLVDFLRARLDEDEQAARDASTDSDAQWHSGASDDPTVEDYERASTAVIDDQDRTVVYDEGSPSKAQSVHIARHDPARVLRDVEARRIMLDVHERYDGTWMLKVLALPYADHSDYREAWRP